MARAPRFRLERDLENYCVRKAHAAGFLSRKMNGRGFRAWPDRLLLWPRGNRQEYVEFKRPGEEPTDLQLVLHRRLRKRGCKVHVLDNYDDFQKLLRS